MLIRLTTLMEKTGEDPARKVPATLSHCMLAVAKKGHPPREAWNICRAQLMRTGYLKGPYRVDARLKASTRQTQKGTRRTMKHGTEKDSHEKFSKFSAMFKKIAPKLVDKS